MNGSTESHHELYSVECIREYSLELSKLMSALDTDPHAPDVSSNIAIPAETVNRRTDGKRDDSSSIAALKLNASSNATNITSPTDCAYNMIDDMIDHMTHSNDDSDLIRRKLNGNNGTKRRKLECVCMNLLLDIEEAIMQEVKYSVLSVTQAIIEELQSGSWRLWGKISTANAKFTLNELNEFRDNEALIYMALVRFAQEAIVPYFVWMIKMEILPRLSKYPCITSDRDLYTDKMNKILERVEERVKMGTYLMMREVLIFNEDRIFRGCTYTEKVVKANQINESCSEGDHGRQSVSEIMANSVLLGSIDRLDGDQSSNFRERVLHELNAYTKNDPSFVKHLIPFDIKTLQTCFAYDGRCLNGNELITYIICQNQAIGKHPLNQLQRENSDMSSHCSNAAFSLIIDHTEDITANQLLKKLKLHKRKRKSTFERKNFEKDHNEGKDGDRDLIIDIIN